MASTSLNKGTRKTYSFEEREILVNLIYKYLNASNVEDKNTTESCATTKRKSVWSQLTEEYNALVGLENSRSTIQLRRCWENMKANKKNRDDKTRLTDSFPQIPPSTFGLPPNVVFQPKESEPFTFEGLMPTTTIQSGDMKKEEELNGDMEEDKANDHESLSMDELPFDTGDPTPTKKLKRKAISPKKQSKQKLQKSSKLQKNSELHEYAISEAQLKLDTAALLKEEAKLKLEEAEYKKEEARMRMICATYKLQKLREECENLIEEDEEAK